MSNKPKLKKSSVRKLMKVKKPANLGFYSLLGDKAGCGTIRIIYPYLLLNHYREEGLNIEANFSPFLNGDPEFYRNTTFVQWQRACTPDHLEGVKWFHKNPRASTSTPLVYEIDDLLIDIPKWNYASKWYMKHKPTTEKILSLMDGIVVSTKRLKDQLSKYNNNIVVVPNHLPKFVWGDIFPVHEYKDEKDKVRILYAGSDNHFTKKELMEKGDKVGGDFGVKLIEFIKKTVNDYHWIISGGIPMELESVKDKIEYHGWKNIFEYPAHLKSLEPDICLAPLMDNEFNRCKSSIKCLEYTAAGSCGVYSNLDPYARMKMKADTDDYMIHLIETLANDIDKRAKVWKHDYEQVKGELFWETNDNLKKYINSYLFLFNQRL